MQPRWRKIWADFWGNKTRTVLVIMSIAVGVFAVGFVSSSYAILQKDMDSEFKKANSSEATIYCDPFKEELLNTLRQVPGVLMVEGRSSITARTQVEPGKKAVMYILSVPPVSNEKWSKMTLEERKLAKQNPQGATINQLYPDGEAVIPPLEDNEILLERTTAAPLHLKKGDIITIELESGRKREMRVAGIVYDINSPPYAFTNWLSGYVNPDTMEWLEGSRDFNSVLLKVKENNTDEEHVKSVAALVADKIEKSGHEVYFTFVLKPGRHWGSDITQALLMVMSILGFLSVLLSGFLVLNTISALLTQQVRQIGIMKAIGARRLQLIGMYFIMVCIFGLVALLLAGLPGLVAGYYASKFIAGFLNFNISPFHLPRETLILVLCVALGAPLLAAVIPVINGTRVTIREAISEYGLGKGRFGKSLIDQWVEQVRFLSRPVLISLRNTFRRKSRLILTLFTLTLGGGIFIAVFNTQAAVSGAIQETMGYFLSDVSVSLSRTYRLGYLEQLVFQIPQIKKLEGWGLVSGEVLSRDEKTSHKVEIMAPPGNATLVQPAVVKGRWLLPSDENALVIGNALVKLRPDLKVGDVVVLKINRRKYPFVIIGIFRMAGMTINPYVYANYDYLSRITHQPDQYANLRIVTEPHDASTQEKVVRELEALFDKEGIRVQELSTRAQIEASNENSVMVIILFLLIMAMLIAVVGGLGLMGTMSMNVIERTREIGVMRAVGANDITVLTIVIVEGIIIGVISWCLGCLLASPITIMLNNTLGESLVSSSLGFVFNPIGYILWLLIVLGISAAASVMPARNASRLTIREVLAYE